MKCTNEVPLVLEYDSSDIRCKDGEAWLERAEINGFGVEAQLEVLEVANEDAMFTNLLFWEWQQEQNEREMDAADYRYHARRDSLLDADWEAA